MLAHAAHSGFDISRHYLAGVPPDTSAGGKIDSTKRNV
jgi:hypothetical protein